MSELTDTIRFATERATDATITFADWEARVASGYYTQRGIDPATGTKWGQALALCDTAVAKAGTVETQLADANAKVTTQAASIVELQAEIAALKNPPAPAPTPTPTPTPTATLLHGIAAGAPGFIAQYFGGNYTGYMQKLKDTSARAVRMDYSGPGGAFAAAKIAADDAGLEAIPILMIRATTSVDTVKAWAANLIGAQHVELGNEMNGAGQWGGTPNIADYKTKAQAAITVLRANPKLRISAGGLAQYGASDATHISAVSFMDGIRDLPVDAFAFHCYGAWAWDTLLPQLMSRVPTDKEVWITEWGFYTTGGQTETQQTTEIAKRLAYMKTQPRITTQLFYSGVDHHTGTTNTEDNYGLFHTDGSAKPGMTAYRTGVA